MTVIAPLRTIDPAPRGDAARAAGARVAELQSRIRGMEARKLEGRAVPTPAALAPVLPGGSLREGSVYVVEGSVALLMTALSAASAAGSWAAIVGLPEFGVEAAEQAGLALDRLVLVPEPGRHWFQATAALADVIPLVAVRPAARIAPADAARFAARLRQRGTVLFSTGDWPQADARLRLERSDWSGLGAGRGRIAGRDAVVTGIGRDARVRRTTVAMPGMPLPGSGGRDAPEAGMPEAGMPEAGMPEAGARLALIDGGGPASAAGGAPTADRRAAG
ncbi:hypothetical protein [Agromyces archimandritae]|uniref:Protein ImuA n=1 Tax=Agromyces archimandritae TaxID=2781962 RepID=A0A975FMS8_9MICO|nr:hypothetical protein [Agromyces archimandritae]QTX04752.1 hypothetical protein G127AT_00265 [Agromyces archimandritae]